MLYRMNICFLFFSIISLLGCTTLTETRINHNPQTKVFIKQMVVKHGFNQKQLELVLNKAQYQPQIIQLMQKPYEAKPWYLYKGTFVNDNRAKEGVKFWKEHEQVLAQVEKDYGVPASIIVAILGVETYYGKIQGNIRVLDSLSTLAFYYPPRAAFFSKELEQFLIMSRETKRDPEKLVGSYAGAFGKTQFMPSSYRHYAVAFHHSGSSDLINNDGDVIASIANYFKMNGWRPKEVIAIPAKINQVLHLSLTGQDMKPTKSIADWENLRIQAIYPVSMNEKAALLMLQEKNGFDYWLGLHNFYVLSRYNPRLNYAMAVYQLSLKIQQMPKW
ncbi:MAG: Membrane-bound lytic murein transglycosylase B [Legionellaceae bacterium]